AATPLGHTYPAIADGLLAGRSGVRAVSSFDVAEHPSQIAGQLGGVPCPAGWDAEVFARRPPLEQLVLWSCAAALRDAGWWERRSAVRFGLVLGLGAEWLVLWEGDAHRGGPGATEPERDRESLVARARRELGLTGPAASVSAACASGNYALAQ